MNEGFLAKIKVIKVFFRVAVNTYVPIFRGLDARGGRKLRTDTRTHARTHARTHTHTHTHIYWTTTVTLAELVTGLNWWTLYTLGVILGAWRRNEFSL